MRRRFRRHRIEQQEMNITAFMNLMVILVPFLLITAVFSRLTILELNLPASSGNAGPQQELQLEIVIRGEAIELGERSSGVLKRFEKGEKGYDLKGLSASLQTLKERYPDKTAISILSEPNTSYETIVQVMDTARLLEKAQGGTVTRYELFPDISIGDAPVRVAAGSKS
jgi:biopolymer transport protein ExbD